MLRISPFLVSVAIGAMLLYLTFTTQSVDALGMPPEELKNHLRAFFKDTYITKLKSLFDPKKKEFKAKGYRANWELHHLHHVCISGGKDGVYVGTDEEVNEWTHKVTGGISTAVWNSNGGRGSMDAVLFSLPNVSTVANYTHVRGSSFMIGCSRQLPDMIYPSMWISKLGSVYEIGRMYANSSTFNSTFNENVPDSFQNMVMHQCADPAVTDWEWGKAVLAVTLAAAMETKMFHGGDSENPTVISGYFYNERVDELVCFDDVYVSLRSGIWLQGAEDLVTFRKHLADIVGEPAEALTKPEEPPVVMGPTTLQPYCTTDGTKSKAKIKIYQRYEGRKFLNLEEVKALVQKYTSVPVEVVSAGLNTSITDLIKLFNDFDVLVTPEGGHLTNGLFTMNPGSKAIVEVSSAVYELLYYKNFILRMGFATYILSDGHLTPAVKCPFHEKIDFERNDCTLDSKAIVGKVPQSYLKCKFKNKNDMKQFRLCDTQVNIESLTKALDRMYGALCPPIVGGVATGSNATAAAPAVSATPVATTPGAATATVASAGPAVNSSVPIVASSNSAAAVIVAPNATYVTSQISGGNATNSTNSTANSGSGGSSEVIVSG
jgi:hypothetical protein